MKIIYVSYALKKNRKKKKEVNVAMAVNMASRLYLGLLYISVFGNRTLEHECRDPHSGTTACVSCVCCAALGIPFCFRDDSIQAGVLDTDKC